MRNPTKERGETEHKEKLTTESASIFPMASIVFGQQTTAMTALMPTDDRDDRIDNSDHRLQSYTSYFCTEELVNSPCRRFKCSFHGVPWVEHNKRHGTLRVNLSVHEGSLESLVSLSSFGSGSAAMDRMTKFGALRKSKSSNSRRVGSRG